MERKNIKWAVLFFLIFLLPVLGQEDDFAEFEEDDKTGSPLGIVFSGFLEIEQGRNITGKGPLRNNGNSVDWIMANRRFRLEAVKNSDKGGIYAKIDFNRDEVTGETKLDIRELRLQYRLFNWLDLSIGRQVSTWGVADMLFINDLFPKNWNANFSGREMEYMKDSSTSFRATSYFGGFILDLVYHPRFTSDTTPTGIYFSVFDPNSGTLISNPSGSQNSMVKSPSGGNDEIAVSLKKRIGNLEFALYGYRGFFKNPKGVAMSDNLLRAYYPELSVVGASVEGQIGPGIFSSEIGYYDSREDRAGKDPMIENSLFKFLLGYKLDLNANITAGIQWYREIMSDYEEYEASVGYSPYRKKKNHDTFTLRITYKAMQDTLFANLFTYFRPQDRDSFTRLDITRKINDNFSVTAGISIFTGKDNYIDREFGMLRHDDNIFVRLRYSF